MRLTIGIHREGQFPVGWHHSHDHQCGNVGTGVLSYKVEIVGNSEHLSKDGYLCDNNSIPMYFSEKYQNVKDFLSCEHIAQTAVKDFLAHFESGNPEWAPQVDRIRVEVTGIEHSGIWAEWNR